MRKTSSGFLSVCVGVAALLGTLSARTIIAADTTAKRPSERPRVVAVTPASGAVGVDPITEIRVQFDLPMDPDKFELIWLSAPGAENCEVGFRLRGEIRYEAGTNQFVFPVKLTQARANRREWPD